MNWGCVCAGQRGCASFLFLAALYIVEGLFKAALLPVRLAPVFIRFTCVSLLTPSLATEP